MAMPDTKKDDKTTDPAPPKAGPTEEAPAFKNAGEEKTQPGQREIISGSVEHEQVLKAYANATSYAPDVNVVPAPVPEAEQRSAGQMPDKPEGDAGLLPSKNEPTQGAAQQAAVKPTAQTGDKK